MKKIALAAVAAVAALLVAAGGVWALSDRDTEKSARGTCATATWELDAEDEDGGVELTFEVQSAAPGEAWQVVLEQDGTEIWSGTRQTDEDAEIDVDTTVREADGSSFRAVATPENGDACTATLER